MRMLGNILWHIPFLGFLQAFLVFILGILLTLTVVASPIGLGLIQYSRFLLAPFSREMIKKSDLNIEQNPLWKTYSTIIWVLYIPFGLVCLLIGSLQIIFLFFSIIGIPVALVVAKSLGVYFNPVNKICVPHIVGAELQRQKDEEIKNRYFPTNQPSNQEQVKKAEKDDMVATIPQIVQDVPVIPQHSQQPAQPQQSQQVQQEECVAEKTPIRMVEHVVKKPVSPFLIVVLFLVAIGGSFLLYRLILAPRPVVVVQRVVQASPASSQTPLTTPPPPSSPSTAPSAPQNGGAKYVWSHPNAGGYSNVVASNASQSSTASPYLKGVILGDHVNFRLEPNTSSKVQRQFNKGAMLHVLQRYSSTNEKYDWFKVRYNNQVGWIYGQFIKVLEE